MKSTRKRHPFWHAVWETICWDPINKRIAWKESGLNSLVDEGEENIGDVYFRELSVPTEFYLRLCNDTLTETDTLNTILGEMSGYGYTPALLERTSVGWPTKELYLGDWRFTSKQITVTASGGAIGPFNTQFLATTSTNLGKLIAFKDLSQPRTILNGNVMLTRFRVTFK